MVAEIRVSGGAGGTRRNKCDPNVVVQERTRMEARRSSQGRQKIMRGTEANSGRQSASGHANPAAADQPADTISLHINPHTILQYWLCPMDGPGMRSDRRRPQNQREIKRCGAGAAAGRSKNRVNHAVAPNGQKDKCGLLGPASRMPTKVPPINRTYTNDQNAI